VTRSRTRTLRRAVVLAVGVVAVDQAVKAVVRTTLDLGERREVLPSSTSCTCATRAWPSGSSRTAARC
jgi:stage V sporulation protein SpoVS